MAANDNLASSYAALNNNQFLYAFVDCSTDIEVVITELLEYMSVRGKANHSLPLSQSFSMKRDLYNELMAWYTS